MVKKYDVYWENLKFHVQQLYNGEKIWSDYTNLFRMDYREQEGLNIILEIKPEEKRKHILFKLIDLHEERDENFRTYLESQKNVDFKLVDLETKDKEYIKVVESDYVIKSSEIVGKERGENFGSKDILTGGFNVQKSNIKSNEPISKDNSEILLIDVQDKPLTEWIADLSKKFKKNAPSAIERIALELHETLSTGESRHDYLPYSAKKDNFTYATALIFYAVHLSGVYSASKHNFDPSDWFKRIRA